MGSVSGGDSSGKSNSSSSVRIPKFLRPLARQGASTASGALTSLTDQINGGNLVADFTGPQELSQLLGVSRALGDGGFFPTAQETFLNAAQGEGLSFVPDDARQALGGAAEGSGLDFIPPEVLQRLMQGGGGQLPGNAVLESLSQNSSIPGQALSVLNAPSGDFSALEGILGEGAINPQARGILESTAQGDFLSGGQGFDEAVQAAVRQATPAILSTFGQAGVGGNTGGLAQTAIGEAAVDAFAQQFANERNNQLGAAGRLADLGLAERGQDASIASTLGELGLGDRGQDIDAASILGGLGLSDAGQRGDFANALSQLGLSQNAQGLSGANSLASLFSDERGNQLSSAEILSQLASGERTNQLNAAQMLPGIGTSDVDLLNSIGLERQAQDQRNITAPMDAQLQLMLASLGIPSSISPFLGSSTDNSFFSRHGNFSMGTGAFGGGGGGGG